MEDNYNVETGNETENFEGESGSGVGKLIAGAFALGAGAFAVGQTVGAKIGNPIDAVKKARAKHKIKKADRKLKKLNKRQDKLKRDTEKMEKEIDNIVASEGATPAEETPEKETE